MSLSSEGESSLEASGDLTWRGRVAGGIVDIEGEQLQVSIVKDIPFNYTHRDDKLFFPNMFDYFTLRPSDETSKNSVEDFSEDIPSRIQLMNRRSYMLNYIHGVIGRHDELKKNIFKRIKQIRANDHGKNKLPLILTSHGSSTGKGGEWFLNASDVPVDKFLKLLPQSLVRAGVINNESEFSERYSLVICDICNPDSKMIAQAVVDGLRVPILFSSNIVRGARNPSKPEFLEPRVQ